MNRIDELLRTTLQKAFPEISEIEIEDLVEIGQVKAYPPGVTLCHEGKVESTFYIMIDGRVEVSKFINETTPRVLRPLMPGDFFGEYALIHEAPRMASVTTSEPTTVVEIYKDQFHKILRRSNSVSRAMVSHVSRRLRMNDEMTIEDLRLKAGELSLAYQRLAEMEFNRREFLTVISHELRTPLTAANGFLQIAKSGALEGPALENAINTVSDNVEKIVKLVNDILFMQEIELILQDAAPMDISAIVRSAMASQQDFATENNVVLNMEDPPELTQVKGDPASIERVFRGILNNAIKFSPKGGRVNITLAARGSDVTVEIQDQGVGIPEESIPLIFDRFYHLENVGEYLFGGLGIGLSIAKQVVDQHGGGITVHSKLGEGSTFTVWLPPEPPQKLIEEV
jgi:signal transduction histidine kinase